MPGVAYQQIHAQFFFQFFNLLGNGALCYEKGFRGCGLLNAAAEFPANSSGRNAVRQHKEQVEAIVAEHLNRLLKDSQRVSYIAAQLSFLLEGSMARAGLEGSSRQLQLARQMAEDILDRECQHD